MTKKNNIPDLKKELMPIKKPEEVINAGIKTAKALKTMIIDSKKDRPVYGKEKKIHIEFSEYQTIGKWYGIGVKTFECGEVERYGARGIKAYGEAFYMETGEVVGYAEASCFKNEPGRGNHTWNQIGSMAQTRAGAKALRNAIGWVVELGGLSATPAEEMQGIKESGTLEEEVNNIVKEKEEEETEEQEQEVQETEETEKNANEEGTQTPVTEQLDDADELTKAEIKEMTAEEIGLWATKKLRAEDKDITGAEIGKVLMGYNRKRWLSTRKFNKVKEWFMDKYMTG